MYHKGRYTSFERLERIPVTLIHFSRVMAGQYPVEDIRASTPVFDGLLRERPYVPAIHALLAEARQKRQSCPRQAGARLWRGDSITSKRALAKWRFNVLTHSASGLIIAIPLIEDRRSQKLKHIMAGGGDVKKEEEVLCFVNWH